MWRPVLLVGLAGLLMLSGCDQLGIESASAIAAQRENEGKAIGGACRHAGRAIEDCYVLNRKADKAAVFAGWREMNDYMRENKIDPVAPQLTAPTEIAKAPVESEKPADKPEAGDKGDKAADKSDKPAPAAAHKQS
jgi:hypothetical protein